MGRVRDRSVRDEGPVKGKQEQEPKQILRLDPEWKEIQKDHGVLLRKHRGISGQNSQGPGGCPDDRRVDVMWQSPRRQRLHDAASDTGSEIELQKPFRPDVFLQSAPEKV